MIIIYYPILVGFSQATPAGLNFGLRLGAKINSPHGSAAPNDPKRSWSQHVSAVSHQTRHISHGGWSTGEILSDFF